MAYFEIYWGEPGGNWPLEHPAAALLSALEHTPFGAFDEMSINDLDDWIIYDDAERWRPYAREEAQHALDEGARPVVDLRILHPLHMSVGIGRGAIRNGIRLMADEKRLHDIDPEAILRFMRQVADCLPRFTDARATAGIESRLSTWKRHLPRLPLMLGWANVIIPRLAIQFYGSIETVLLAPAYRGRLLENGLIEVLVSPNPLDYEQSEGQQRFIEVTQYLAHHRADL